MKTILARLCRPLLERLVFTRHLPPDLGGAGIYVSPRSDARVLRQCIAEMDPDLLAAARLMVHQGAKVWDIGSNLGVFSMAAAHLAGVHGAVLAVDADAGHIELLRRTARRAGSTNVTPLHCGVSGSVGVSRLNVVGRGKAKNFLMEANSGAAFGEVVEQHAVVTVTLDWLAMNFGAPDALKVDVEGAELMAMKGAATLLQGARPVIYIEVQAGNTDAITALLRSNRYSLFELEGKHATIKPITACEFNTLAVPEERAAAILSRGAHHA